MRRLAILIMLFSLISSLAHAAENLPQESSELEAIGVPQAAPDAQLLQEVLAEEEATGLVTMDFEDADIRDVIKVVAMASGMNMVIGKDVEAKVTISLKDLQWERALDVILRTYNFTYKKEENLLRIMTFEKVKQEERDIPLITKIIYLNFAEVGAVKSTLATTLSERGSIEIDSRTNSLLITDIPAKVEETEMIAKKLDTRTPQVLIEAMLVNVTLTKDDELGINWKILNVNMPDNQVGKGDAITGAENYVEVPSGTMNSLGSQAINLGFLKRFGDLGVDGLVSAWVSDAKANILASPKIVTLDNETAKIEIKSQVAYSAVSTGEEGGETTSTQFKDVITGLEVTPHITKEGYVSMNVKPQQEFVDGTVGGEPRIASRTAETNVLVKDGETLVLGGLRQVDDNLTITKVPFLGDIPFLGKLFQKKDINKINTELLMFVTPHIIDKPILTDEEIDRYKMLDDAREDFVKDMEKEKIKRMKRKRAHALLVGPQVTEDLASSGVSIEDIDKQAAPIRREEKEEIKLEETSDYIYTW